jgi:hypothetical protein
MTLPRDISHPIFDRGAKVRAGLWLNGKGKVSFSLPSRIVDIFPVIDPGAISRRDYC